MGQNFLKDKAVLDEIATYIYKTTPTSRIVEIGAGTGNLTSALLNKGCQDLVAIELDHRCMEDLKKLSCLQLSIIHQDARKIKWEELGKNLHIVGNLPYNVATHLILQWGEMTHLWSNCTVMIQKEVADKILSDKGSGLSIITSLFFSCKKVLDVRPESFYPVPRVESTVIHLIPKKEIQKVNLPNLKRMLRVLFERRRKMISHSLDKKALEELEISPRSRPEELTLNQFILLADNVKRLLLCD